MTSEVGFQPTFVLSEEEYERNGGCIHSWDVLYICNDNFSSSVFVVGPQGSVCLASKMRRPASCKRVRRRMFGQIANAVWRERMVRRSRNLADWSWKK